MKQKNRLKKLAVFVLIAFVLTAVTPNVAFARRTNANDGWKNPACTTPTTKLTGNAYEQYIMKLRGTTTYTYIPANCPTCNTQAPAPKQEDEEPPPPPRYVPPPPTATAVACTPSYDAPRLTGGGQDPPYPLTMGQDPDKKGVTLRYAGSGGARNNGCNEGPAIATLTDFRITSVELTPQTVAWINGELAQLYPGAHVKDNYPLIPPFTPTGLGSSSATLETHIDPLDPGDYVVTVQLQQHDGQTVALTSQFKVWLFESTITGP